VCGEGGYDCVNVSTIVISPLEGCSWGTLYRLRVLSPRCSTAQLRATQPSSGLRWGFYQPLEQLQSAWMGRHGRVESSWYHRIHARRMLTMWAGGGAGWGEGVGRQESRETVAKGSNKIIHNWRVSPYREPSAGLRRGFSVTRLVKSRDLGQPCITHFQSGYSSTYTIDCDATAQATPSKNTHKITIIVEPTACTGCMSRKPVRPRPDQPNIR
jgi:hypothetical protein